MDETIEPRLPSPATPPAQADTRVRRGSPLAIVLGLLAVGAGAYAVWRVTDLERGLAAASAAGRDDIQTRLQPLLQNDQQVQRELDALRARLADGDSVNRSLREEVLGLGERSRNLEDAIANLADQRLSSRDAIALNEAEYLLLIARQRLELFQDVPGTLAAYRLADGALAAAENPLYASTRQTIAAEIEALNAAHPGDTQSLLAALEAVRSALASWPSRPLEPATAAAADSRFARMFGAFVRVSREGVDAVASRDTTLARSLVTIDLRSAEAAVLARDADAYARALASARANIQVAFDTDSEPVRTGQDQLAKLAATALAPDLPALGTALKELRNLRATRALSQPVAPPPAPDASGAEPAVEPADHVPAGAGT